VRLSPEEKRPTMRPYGVKIEERPDVADIKAMGSKGSVGVYAGRSGDYHPIARGNAKARVRRYWKRAARRENAAACGSYED
jgi:hypothetical protein